MSFLNVLFLMKRQQTMKKQTRWQWPAKEVQFNPKRLRKIVRNLKMQFKELIRTEKMKPEDMPDAEALDTQARKLLS
jgi:hypothetical protein